MVRRLAIHAALGVALAAIGGAAAAQGSAIAIRNESDVTVTQFFLSPSNRSEWGRDQLRANVVTPGQTWTLRNIPPGSYDSQIVLSNGRRCQVNGARVEPEKTYNYVITPRLVRDRCA